MENKKEKNLLALPHELIVEILQRLPVRSLLRFKRVCKSWFSLISDPQFAKSHFDLNAAPTHRLLLRFLDDDKVESIDLESSLGDPSAVVTLNLPPPCMSRKQDALFFFGSCRGFMLLAYDYKRVIVLNPSTGFRKQILNRCDFMLGSLYGFGYHKSSDDYFLVLIDIAWGRAKIQAFSVKTNSWCETKCVSVPYLAFGCDYRHGVFFNDSLHWLVMSNETRLLVVIAYDLLENGLSEIPLSPELAAPVLVQFAPKLYLVRVLGGCLSLCYTGNEYGKAEIWVMKEYKVQSSWTKAFVLDFWDIPCVGIYPIRITEGGGVVGSNGSGRLMKFNAKGALLEHHKYGQEYKNVQKISELYREIEYKNVLKYFEMYRESLLSFPGEQPLLCGTSLTHDFNKAIEVEEATEDVEATEDGEDGAAEVEEATDDEEEESEEEATEDDNI